MHEKGVIFGIGIAKVKSFLWVVFEIKLKK